MYGQGMSEFSRLPFSPDADHLKESIRRHVRFTVGKSERYATPRDRYYSLCLSVRDMLVERWIRTQGDYYDQKVKRVYYLSLEFLMGRALRNAIINLGLLDDYRKAMADLGYSFDELEDLEHDAALGNGGLGRLAACFLDSMATLGIPGYGYGIRYDYGIFSQAIENGWQKEEPDDWLRFPNPWEVPRPERVFTVKYGGRVEERAGGGFRWIDTEDVLASAYDTPIPGFGNEAVNTLRLWEAKATEEFSLEDFNAGDYVGSVEHMVLSRTISRVLYPNDNIYLGQELRLKQQYFLVSASLQDAVERHLKDHPSLDNLAGNAVFQLNDTHPALAIPELMRILLDEYDFPWEKAWRITSRCMAYTNHTLLPEALETWSVDLLGRLLPRHLYIINKINHDFLDEVRRKLPGDPEIASRMSVYQEGYPKRVRMAHLATIGSFSVNGVAALHTELLKSRVLKDFNTIWPERFNNKTNGVTQRRWLLSANEPLAGLITEAIGPKWTTQLSHLEQLVPLAEDASFQQRFAATKQQAKERLVRFLTDRHDLVLDPATLFDTQIKRMHEYKRQLLNVLNIVHLYKELERNPNTITTPRTFLFAGKAAPGYTMAKLIIKLINDVAQAVNAHPEVSKKLRVHFIPDYGVTKAEYLIPATDISEQISTAGFEASGTGNMKFMLNGALTIGTLDGANIEMAEEVGPENIFIFGKTVEEVTEIRKVGHRPREFYESNAHLKEVIDLIASGHFSKDDPHRFQPIVDALLGSDFYLLFADFDAYRETHRAMDRAYQDTPHWLAMAIRNVAHAGKFSSDRTIRQYASEIWKVPTAG